MLLCQLSVPGSSISNLFTIHRSTKPRFTQDFKSYSQRSWMLRLQQGRGGATMRIAQAARTIDRSRRCQKLPQACSSCQQQVSSTSESAAALARIESHYCSNEITHFIIFQIMIDISSPFLKRFVLGCIDADFLQPNNHSLLFSPGTI